MFDEIEIVIRVSVMGLEKKKSYMVHRKAK